MATIEPLRQDIENPDRIKKNSRGLRLWHWVNVLIISGSLATVLINSTVLDDHETGTFISHKLVNPAVTQEQANSTAHALSDRVWDVHIWFGYFLAAFFLFRLLIELFQRGDQKFFGKLKQAWQDYFVLQKERRLARHELTVKLLYLAFYLVLFVMVATGLTLAFKAALHIPRNVSHSIKEVHGFCMYLVIAFIVVHIAGVFLAERKDSPGILSDMINGGRQQE